MKKLQTLPCSLRITPNSVFPPRAYCSTLLWLLPQTAENFSEFSAIPRIFILKIHTSNCYWFLWFPPRVQTFRTSNCLLWLLQHLKEKCGPGISPPIQMISSQTCENPLMEKVNFNPSVQLVTIYKERQGAGYLIS